MKHDHLHLDTVFVPFNPKAHWKKMFSREYGVQYTEISLRSLSPEVGILPHSFLEQIYVPDGNNEVCYVDEHQWDKFLSLLHQKWADHPADFEKIFIECGTRYLSYARDTAELDVKKESNASLLRHYKKYQKLCADYTAFIWAAYYLNEFCAERARHLVQAKCADSHTYYEAIFTPPKKAAIIELTDSIAGTTLTQQQMRDLHLKYLWLPCLDVHNAPWTFDEFLVHLKDFDKKKKQPKLSYEQALGALHVSSKERGILDAAHMFTYFKDLRDDFRRQAIYYIRSSLFREIASRMHITLEDFSYVQEKEIIDFLQTGVFGATVEERKKGFVMMYNSQKEIVCVSGDYIADVLVKLGLKSGSDELSQIKGTPASRGLAKGRVVIVKGVKDLVHIQKGDILVAVTTHPDFVPAMQKAAAIVTDEGGMTSHAAIVSREFGIPCVAGTKVATKKLANGNIVEVDGTEGLVHILKK